MMVFSNVPLSFCHSVITEHVFVTQHEKNWGQKYKFNSLYGPKEILIQRKRQLCGEKEVYGGW